MSGQCGALPTTPLTAAGAGNDLIDCLQCTMDKTADALVSFYLHRGP